MREVVIIDGVRTAIGSYGGGLASVRPDDLLAETYKALITRSGLDPAQVDDVYAGCGNQAGEDNRDVAILATGGAARVLAFKVHELTPAWPESAS